MTISVSFVDHTGLDRSGLSYIAAMRDLHRALDSCWGLRQLLGPSLAPEPFTVTPLGGGLYAVTKVLEDKGAVYVRLVRN